MSDLHYSRYGGSGERELQLLRRLNEKDRTISDLIRKVNDLGMSYRGLEYALEQIEAQTTEPGIRRIARNALVDR